MGYGPHPLMALDAISTLMARYAIMKAALLIRERVVFPDGAIVEMVAWRVPSPVWPSLHEFKYRLVYIVEGVLGYDNERGKGGHRHQGEREQPFEFVSVNALVDRFVEEVEDLRREP